MKTNWMAVLIVALACVVILSGGCTFISSKDAAVIDHQASVWNGIADRMESNDIPDPVTWAWIAENQRRVSENLSCAAHWQAPKYKYPASQPTTLPWTPQDDTSGKFGSSQ